MIPAKLKTEGQQWPANNFGSKLLINRKVEYKSIVLKPREQLVQVNKKINDYIRKKIIENNGLKWNNFGCRYKSYAKATEEYTSISKTSLAKAKENKNTTQKETTKKKTKQKQECKETNKTKEDTALIEAMTEIVEINRKLVSAIVDIIDSESKVKHR